MIQVVKSKVEVTSFDIEIKCLPQDLTQTYKLNVTMTQHSKHSRHLLRPANHSISIQVECGAPHSTRLLWAQANSSSTAALVNLPNSRMHQSQRVHYALVNSQHQVRSLVLKADSKAYLNSSSIIANVHSSDT